MSADPTDLEIQAVMQRAVDAVKLRNDGALPADDLMVFLACEIVARDKTLAEVGKLSAKRICDQLDMDSRRREVALRAEVEHLNTQRDTLRRTLGKCFDRIGKEIQRKTLNESAADGTQAISREVAQVLDATA